MAKKQTYDTIMAEYAAKYEVTSLQNPNDQANLKTMVRNQLLIEKLQDRLDGVANDGDVDPTEVKRILSSIVELSQVNMNYEKILGIDRRSRKLDEAESFPDYLVHIKRLAREFINDDRFLTRIYCKNGCNIMVGRISGVYDTTEFTATFQCPQCKKFTQIKRKERDVFFDVKDAAWRREFPMEVIQPKKSKAPVETMDESFVLDDEEDNTIIEGL